MILKNIFGKTVEAAKKTAQQMYGEDVLILETQEPTSDGKKAQITIVADQNKKQQAAPKPALKSFTNTMQEEEAGVQFERSGFSKPEAKKKESSNLISLRKYATEQIIASSNTENTNELEPVEAEAKQELPQNEEQKENSSQTYYRRSNIRPFSQPKKIVETEESELKDEAPKTVIPKNKNKFITHFRETKPAESKTEQVESIPTKNDPASDKRAIKALHKRFDKLEALLDAGLMAANLNYASHPAFQQLVHTGISTSIISGWFNQIIKTGTDPFDHPELFMAKLAGIIRDSLGKPVTKETSKFLMFAGAAGSGKTNLIMKLATHPDFMLNKTVAVIDVHPMGEGDEAYYSILEAFCTDHHIPYLAVKKGIDIQEYIEELDEYDHVLIDTPSLGIEHEESFRAYWKIRQVLMPLTPLEVHFVVNAASNAFYFKDNTAKDHPLQPDYLAITHLDEVKQWGPVIPFIKEMDCSVRYQSTGKNMASLNEFDSRWFAQKVLEV